MQLLKCALILALLGAACAGSTPVARTTHASLNEDTQDCELCKIVITTLEQYVRDPSVQQSVQDSLNGIICSELPASMRASCTEEIRVMVVEVAAAVISVLPPSRVCSQLGVCSTPAGPAALLAVPHNGPLDCPMCRILVASLVARLRDPAARRELEREAHAACAASAASPASCSAHVTALFEAADAVLADLDPEKACEIANICEPWAAGEAGQAAKGSEGALVQTTSLARAAQDAELLASLAASRWAARAQEGALAGSGDVFCKDCMALATQLQAALRDPELQADVLASLASWCAAVPAFQAGCEQGLRDAGREVLQALVAALEPRDVCGALQLCPARAELRAGLALAAQ